MNDFVPRILIFCCSYCSPIGENVMKAGAKQAKGVYKGRNIRTTCTGRLDPTFIIEAFAECADGIIIVHPNWWGQPPAILKGWVDRIIRPGVAYEFLEDDQGEGVPNGLLKAGSAILFNTSNTEIKREMAVFGDPLETLWKNCIFGLCGVDKFYRKMFTMVVVSSEAQRTSWLEEVRQTVSDCFPSSE